MNKEPKPRRSRKLLKIGLGGLAFSAAVAGGFAKASSPIPPSPAPGQKIIAEWSGRPLIPDAVDSTLSELLPSGHKADMSSDIRIYSEEDHTYAVMENTIYGSNSVTTTLTCKEGGLNVTYDPGKHLLGQALFLQSHTYTSPPAQEACHQGNISLDGIKTFLKSAS